MNPIKSSDIFKDDGTLDSLLKKLERIETVIVSLVEIAKKLNAETKSLNVTNSKDNEVLSKKAKETDLVAKEMEKYLKALDETNVKVQQVRAATNEMNKAAKLEADVRRTQYTSLNNYNAQLKQAKQRYEQLTESEKENTKEGKKLEDQIVRLTARINEQKKAQKDSIRERQLELKVNKSAEGSYDQLSAQYSLIKIRLNAMSSESRKFTKEGQALEERAKSIYKEMDRLQEVTGKNQLKVGGYKEALDSAGLGFDGLRKKIKLFLANPIVAIVAALAGGLIALGSAFKRTEQGMNLVNTATGYVKAIFSELVEIAGKVGEKLTGFFNKVRDVTSKIFGKREQGEVTGFRKKIKDLADEVKETAKAFAQLERDRRAVILTNNKLSRSVEKLTTQEEKLRQVSDDSTLSFKAQEDALRELEKVVERKSRLEVQIANNNLSIIQREIALRKANGEIVDQLLGQELTAIQAVEAAQREYILFQQELATQERQIKQDKLERDLDILIDGFDNQKTINERIIANDEEALYKRKKLLEETIALGESSFKRQIETIQEFTNISVDANSLITESDAIALNEKIRALGLSEIIEGRLLEIVRDRKTAIQDLKDASVELNNETAALFDESDLIKKDLDKIEEDVKEFVDNVSEEIEDIKLKDPVVRNSIFDFLGINIGDEGSYKNEIKSALDYAKGQLLEFAALQTKLAEQRVQDSQNTVNALENELQTQIELARLGYANRVADVQRQLQLEKKAQDEALAERKKAQQQQLAIQTIEQASSLATAAAKLWSQFQLGAIPLIALMFGSFTAAKIKSFQIAKEEFSEGMFEKIGGGSHASGNDTFIGMTNSGKAGYAERGEGHAVFNKNAMDKYGDHIQDFVHGVNKGHFGDLFKNTGEYTTDGEKVQQGADMSVAEGELKRIREQGEHRLASGAGMIIEKYKSVTRYYK